MRPTRWLVVTVPAPSDAQRDALAEGLLALGGTAILEEGASLTTYIAAPADIDSWLDHARSTLSDLVGEQAEIDGRLQDDEDWSESWKKGLRPRRVGRGFIVTPSWSAPEAQPDDRVIVIDPEMAFGTGEHATTRGALRFLETVAQAGDRVLDVGTGSAILAIGAAMLGAAEVVAVDNDADAILNARDNVVRNGVAAIVRLEECIVDRHYLTRAGGGRYDIILANVLSSVLKPLLAEFFRSVIPDGHVILGGILQTESEEMLDAAAVAGFHIIAEDLEDEWWGVLLQRPAPSPQ